MLQPADEVVHVHGKDISIQTAMPTHRLINMVYSKPYHFHIFFFFIFLLSLQVPVVPSYPSIIFAGLQ